MKKEKVLLHLILELLDQGFIISKRYDMIIAEKEHQLILLG